MKKGGDTIQMEYRYEIEEIITALSTFVKEHPKAKEKETVKKMINILDVMHMEW